MPLLQVPGITRLGNKRLSKALYAQLTGRPKSSSFACDSSLVQASNRIFKRDIFGLHQAPNLDPRKMP